MGERFCFSMNDVVFNGILSEKEKCSISTTYAAGNVSFIIFASENYGYEIKDIHGSLSKYLKIVKI